VELVQANEKIFRQREHLHFITKLLRHDLKNNLVAIQSALKIYKQRSREELLTEANSKAQNSIELISKMKELEDLLQEQNSLQPFVLGDVLKKVMQNYPEQEFSYISSAAVVLANEMIFSVFDNIIGNAFTHAKVGKLSLAVKEISRQVIVEIADTGLGIPDEIKAKIFQESFVHGESGNTGLGLFIAQKAMELFGGSIEVEDNQPSGTIFKIIFPHYQS